MSANFNTPILLLIFNRPQVTQLVFNKIKEVKPRYLYVAADGPRTDKIHDTALCEETRKIIDQVNWECEVITLFRNENLGCGFAVSSAITWFFEHVEEGIILEDDCLPDISFFRFCSELLNKYRNDDSVYLISGTNLYSKGKQDKVSYYFSNYTITWGWASWRRAWNHFNHEISDPEHSFESGALDHAFQSPGEKSYWKNKVKTSIAEKKNIWDYQWFFTIWKHKGLGITPNVNLISNIGFRNGGSHTFLKDSLREPSSSSPVIFPLKHPAKEVNRKADQFIFKNAFSYSTVRLLRLVQENGIIAVIKYTMAKLYKK